MDTMNFVVQILFGILFIIVLSNADIDQLNAKYKTQCQKLQCNSSIEICRVNSKCNGSEQDELLKCVYCGLKINLTISKSNERKTLHDNQDSRSQLSYEEYYEYDEDETSDKNPLGGEDEYLDEYVEPFNINNHRTKPSQKLGICPKVVEATGKCDTEKMIQPICRVDTDCPGDLKCCEAACGRRVCNEPVKQTITQCPASFQCSLSCHLGYRIDSNGCLKCECQSCPSMKECNKNCPSDYLKDLFGCDTCECNDQCPPFSCNILCPPGVSFMQSENGCTVCQCALSKSKPIETTSLCQKDVHCPPGFRCLNDAHNVPICQAVPTFNLECPNDFATTCNLQCPNGNVLLDEKGCPTCACAPNDGIGCPEIKCRANCGEAGYQVDENGCQTCKCAVKENVECSRVMCRMYCFNGFKRDENGCEYCACNESPQACPPLNCQRTCANGYRKDYSGCETCECFCPPIACSESANNCTNGLKKDVDGCTTCSCNEQQDKTDDKCLSLDCDLKCKYGLQRDELGCKVCACNRCPTRTCRMFCMYGFRRNEDGCEVCECDWTPVQEKIQCSERIPCEGNRVCNSNLKLCETVSPDRVNWFVYDFGIKSDIFNDRKFLQTFKNGLIRNIATKYRLQSTQITVSSVERDSLTSFQIMPFFSENMKDFEKKMDQIDIDLNTNEFRMVLPSVARAIEENNVKYPAKNGVGKWCSKLKSFTRDHPKTSIVIIVFLFTLTTIITIIVYVITCRRRGRKPNRSESKVPIYDTSYQQAPTDDDHIHAVYAPDGTTYVVVQSDDTKSSNAV